MLAEMRAIQVYEWEQYYQLEPFGSEVDELRYAGISSVIANVNRSANTNPYKPSDFFVTISRDEPPQSVEHMLATLKGALGG